MRKLPSDRLSGLLSVPELSNVNIVILRILQGQCFGEEIFALRFQRPLRVMSKLLPLNPFFDSDGI